MQGVVRFIFASLLSRLGREFPYSKARLCLCSVFLALVVTSSLAQVNEQQPRGPSQASVCDKQADGCIVGIKGRWVKVDRKSGAQTGTDLRFGESIEGNSCVAGRDGATSLSVLFGGKAVSFACEGKPDPPCGQPIGTQCARHIIPPEKKSWVVSLTAAFGSAFSEPDRYVIPVSRGLEPYLVDSVLSLDDGRVDLAPTFREMEPGKYQVRFEPLAQAKTIAQAPLKWTGKGPATVAVAGISPGLYRLVQVNTQSEPVEPGAWVLVDGPDRFRKDSASFQSAQEEIKAWPDDVDPRAPQAVLRAYLDSLAKGVQ
jgi:hypothetical protein